MQSTADRPEARSAVKTFLTACYVGCDEAVRRMLDGGFDVNTEVDGIDGLYAAVRRNRASTVRLLLERGARPIQCDRLVGLHTRDLEIPAMLVGCGLVPDGRSGSQLPLEFAVVRGDLAMVEYLLALGADVNAETLSRWTPLLLACLHRNEAVIRVLLRHGADRYVNICRPRRSAMAFAAELAGTLDAMSVDL